MHTQQVCLSPEMHIVLTATEMVVVNCGRSLASQGRVLQTTTANDNNACMPNGYRIYVAVYASNL